MGTDSITWHREEHTKAKHELLKAFFVKWVSVHSGSFAQRGGGLVRVYDGFAGPGVYAGGEPGSPRILIDALLDHPHFGSHWGAVRYEFSFVEQDARRAQCLRDVLTAVQEAAERAGRWSDNMSWSVTTGRYEDNVPQAAPAPSALFLFLDPFGYSHAPMTLTGELLRHPKCDALIFVPLSHLHRFADRDGQGQALDRFFGTPDWRRLKNDGNRPSAMLSLFRSQIKKSGLRYVGEFRLRPSDRNNEYWLVGASDDPKGFEALKEAFWKVDPVDGRGYDAPRLPARGQRTFVFDAESALRPEGPNTAGLLELLWHEFGDEPFTVEDALDYTTKRTRFLPGQLRRHTLVPAEGHYLHVDRPQGARGFDRGKGIVIRFIEPVELEYLPEDGADVGHRPQER